MRSHEGRRKMHKVAWLEVIKPKCLGGREGGRLPSMAELNLAMLGKLRLRFLRSQGYKYLRPQGGDREKGSHIWKGIRLSTKQVILKGARWIPDNGRDIRFWQDKWLEDGPLMDWAIGDLGDLANLKITDFWTED
ncbi:hypothetical protein V2J09_017201 [Rumex salicifolius]